MSMPVPSAPSKTDSPCCAAHSRHDGPSEQLPSAGAHGQHAPGPAGHGHPAGAHAGHGQHAHGHAGHAGSPRALATSATIHCLTGCAIGEFIGLAIGVTLGLNPWATMALATALGFASGYSLGLWPLVKQGMSWRAAFGAIWLGETISIAVMEFAMNFTDYHVGGVHAASMLSPIFWVGYAAALPAGFIVAWPVNYWLLKRNVKQPCH